jgi:hypothetical protein
MHEIVLRSTLQAYKAASDFVKLGRCGLPQHQSSDAPFMLAAAESDTEAAVAKPSYNESVEKLLDEVPLPPELCRVYRVIARPACEYVFGMWILMSLEQAAEKYTIRVRQGQLRAVDFALRYEGLGHCQICSYDPTTKRVYYRADGGSNGFDVQRNCEHANSHVPTEDESRAVGHWIAAAEAAVRAAD